MNAKRLDELRSYKGSQKRMTLCLCVFTDQMSKITGALDKKRLFILCNQCNTAGGLFCVDLSRLPCSCNKNRIVHQSL